MEKQLTETLLEMVLLPLGILVMLSNVVYYMVIMPKKDGSIKYQLKTYCQKFLLFWILFGVLTFVGIAMLSIYNNKGKLYESILFLV